MNEKRGMALRTVRVSGRCCQSLILSWNVNSLKHVNLQLKPLEVANKEKKLSDFNPILCVRYLIKGCVHHWPALGAYSWGIWRSSTSSWWGGRAGSRTWKSPARWWSSSPTSAWCVGPPGAPAGPPPIPSWAPATCAPSGHSTPSPAWRAGRTSPRRSQSCRPGSHRTAPGPWCQSTPSLYRTSLYKVRRQMQCGWMQYSFLGQNYWVLWCSRIVLLAIGLQDKKVLGSIANVMRCFTLTAQISVNW